MRRRRLGITLLELLVVLTVIALAGTLTLPALRARTPASHDARTRIATARHAAIERRRPVTIVLDDSLGNRVITALPDGSVLNAESFGIDRSSGRPAR